MPSLKRTKNVSEIPSGIKYTAKALQALSTTLTVAFAKTLFTTPIKYKLPKRELEMDKNTIQELKTANLRGRGGAGFPTGLKWSFLAKPDGVPRYLVCNADESEPGTFKDRTIMEEDPFSVIEAMTLVAYAAGIENGWIFVRGEYPRSHKRLQQAIKKARAAGYLGRNIMGRDGFHFDIDLRLGAGAYICGEETALLESLEGKKGQPRFKPPFPASYGLYGKPTTINNTETFAAVPWIIRNGGEAYLACGKPNNGGTKIFSVSGDVQRPGNYEVPLGTPFAKLLELAGGMRPGRQLKAVIPGGSSMPVLPADIVMATDMNIVKIQNMPPKHLLGNHRIPCFVVFAE